MHAGAMFSIGEFARLGGVSIRTLRHYDEIGLLRPVTVDPDTGYRGYSAAQLGQINRIMALKELGLSLTQVRLMLDGGHARRASRHAPPAARAAARARICLEQAGQDLRWLFSCWRATSGETGGVQGGDVAGWRTGEIPGRCGSGPWSGSLPGMQAKQPGQPGRRRGVWHPGL
jgi:DNA-binding transcriptional MerR regulator